MKILLLFTLVSVCLLLAAAGVFFSAVAGSVGNPWINRVLLGTPWVNGNPWIDARLSGTDQK